MVAPVNSYYGSHWDGYTKPTDTLIIPGTVLHEGTAYTVTRVGDYAFYACTTITHVTLPSSMVSVGKTAFGYDDSRVTTRLSSVVLNEGLVSIGENAFSCAVFERINLPSTLTSIGPYAFSYCRQLQSVSIPNAVTHIGRNAFESPKSDKDYANGMGRRALKSWLRYGYIPLEDSVKEAFHTQEQVSRTLEYAYDDYCVAQVAKALNQKKDYETLMRRSRNWKNVLNPRTGWADGRHANGSWLMNRDLTSRLPFITEGAVMHYSFHRIGDDNCVKRTTI